MAHISTSSPLFDYIRNPLALMPTVKNLINAPMPSLVGFGLLAATAWHKAPRVPLLLSLVQLGSAAELPWPLPTSTTIIDYNQDGYSGTIPTEVSGV